MTCKKCKKPMTIEDVSVKLADHDDTLLDIVITCPSCGHGTFEFVDTKEAVDFDD